VCYLEDLALYLILACHRYSPTTNHVVVECLSDVDLGFSDLYLILAVMILGSEALAVVGDAMMVSNGTGLWDGERDDRPCENEREDYGRRGYCGKGLLGEVVESGEEE